MSDKVILTVATTGAVTPKELNPNVPITPKEIAEDAYKCWKAGASVVHLHMRDDQGLGTMDKHKFKETIDRIRDTCDIVINVTTAGDHRATYEQRMEHLKTVPNFCPNSAKPCRSWRSKPKSRFSTAA